jgi:hypothetical protein
MSRTDKTRPLWVRVNDALMVNCEPVHDHRSGPCTLPDRVTPETFWPTFTPGCSWSLTTSFAREHGGHNGCRACTDYYHRREERRRSRRRARRELRAYNGED